MEFLKSFLPIIIYIALIVFIVVAIILGIKLIIVITKAERVVDNVEKKVNALNGLFNIIEATSNKINGVYEKLFSILSSAVTKVLKKKDEEEEYEEEK